MLCPFAWNHYDVDLMQISAHAHCRDYCTGVHRFFKAHANGRNRSQHCCVLLANNVASVWMGLKVWPANKCQHCCGSMQTDATLLVQQCCVLLADNVASVYIGLRTTANNVGSSCVCMHHATSANKCQHCWANIVVTCCVCLHGH